MTQVIGSLGFIGDSGYLVIFSDRQLPPSEICASSDHSPNPVQVRKAGGAGQVIYGFGGRPPSGMNKFSRTLQEELGGIPYANIAVSHFIDRLRTFTDSSGSGIRYIVGSVELGPFYRGNMNKGRHSEYARDGLIEIHNSGQSSLALAVGDSLRLQGENPNESWLDSKPSLGIISKVAIGDMISNRDKYNLSTGWDIIIQSESGYHTVDIYRGGHNPEVFLEQANAFVQPAQGIDADRLLRLAYGGILHATDWCTHSKHLLDVFSRLEDRKPLQDAELIVLKSALQSLEQIVRGNI